jgi:hypothetical protein
VAVEGVMTCVLEGVVISDSEIKGRLLLCFVRRAPERLAAVGTA